VRGKFAFPFRGFSLTDVTVLYGCVLPGLRITPGTRVRDRATKQIRFDDSRKTAHDKLFAKAGFYRDPLAPLGAAAGKNLLAALGLHARAKSMLFDSLAPIGLERTFGHEK
jgi:hypothetical protein